jgi:hypothetical protein
MPAGSRPAGTSGNLTRHGLPRHTTVPFATSGSSFVKPSRTTRGVPFSREKPAPWQRTSTALGGTSPSTCTRAASSPLRFFRTFASTSGTSSAKARGIFPARATTATRSSSTATIHPSLGRLSASRTVPVFAATPA